MSLISVTALVLSATTVQQPAPDSLDRAIQREMQRRNIPGLSIAVIDSGRIVLARGYGVTKRGGNTPVTAATLFQAGSISKPVTAVGAMRLVQRGTLELDRDVNEQLVSWKVPDTTSASGEKVTVRGLLSHSAGLNVHGFDGYVVNAPHPTLVQVLDGVKPANSPAVRVVQRPGERHRYSGGGYTILQQLMIDITHQPFDEYMMREVLAPAGMTSSTFAQPLPPSHAPNAATGHVSDGTPVPGGWHVYPEMAAAGLWSTPSDLARFAIALQRAANRDSAAFLQPNRVQQMLSYQRNDFMGLGVYLRGNNSRLEFSHTGRDEGFDASMTATVRGQGVVIMMNANDDSDIMGRIQRMVSRMYNWPNYRPQPVSPRAAASTVLATDDLNGHYEYRNHQVVTLAARDGQLYSFSSGREDEEFVPTGPDRFTRADGGETFQFVRDGARRVVGASVTDPDGTRAVPRIGPIAIAKAFAGVRDPDPARTRRLADALRAMADGKTNSRSFTPGALRDFGSEPLSELAGITGVSFVGEEDVGERGINRHGGAVARIVYLKATIGGTPQYVLVFLTKEGLLTEIDHFAQ
jgi:CubicO group peptidase (beta-lactamase class C family)